MAEILSKISTISFVLAALFLILSIVLWFKLKIKVIIGDLSGRNAKKSIAKMRETNEKTGKKSFRPSSVNLARGKLTDAIKQSGSLETDVLEENHLGNVNENQTELLDAQETELLSAQETELLDENCTGLLDENSTTLLSDSSNDEGMGAVELKIIDEVMLIHTHEVI